MACFLPRGVLQAAHRRHLDRDLDSIVVLQILLQENLEVVTIVLTAAVVAVVKHGSMALLQASTHHVHPMQTIAVILLDSRRFSLRVQDTADIRY